MSWLNYHEPKLFVGDKKLGAKISLYISYDIAFFSPQFQERLNKLNNHVMKETAKRKATLDPT